MTHRADLHGQRSRRARVAVVALSGAVLAACTGPAPTPTSPTSPTPVATESSSTGSSPTARVPTTTSAPAASAAVPRGIAWHACADVYLRESGAQCGTLAVPLDYAHPDGTQITLAISRVRHDVPASRYLGVMLTNPGGPGGSGLSLSTIGAAVPGGVGKRYDWIGIDPRGVGASRPRVTCDATITAFDRPDYRATTPTLQRYWLNRSRSYAEDCAAKNGALLPHLSTEDSARDLDSVRAALGVAKVSYYGFSFGTYLGQVYATLFPRRLSRIVLDSNVDPRGVWYPAQLAQDVAFQGTVRRFFGWVAHYDGVFGLGRTEPAVERRFTTELDQLAKHPVQGKIGPDELTDTLSQAAYYQFVWPEVAQAWAALAHSGSIADLLKLGLGPADDNGYAVYNAVQCSDARWPSSYATWKADAIATDRRAPFETWDNVWFNASCLYWPVAAGIPVRIDLSAAPPALLVDETLDGATPYAGSLYVRSIYPAARLLAIPGGISHAASLRGNACEDKVISTYLATGALPARQPGNSADATCAPLPAPTPLAAS